MYNQCMSLAPNFSERSRDAGPPKKMNIFEYASDVPLYNNEPTVVIGRIYNTPGNTPLNTPKGSLLELEGKFGRPNHGFEYYF